MENDANPIVLAGLEPDIQRQEVPPLRKRHLAGRAFHIAFDVTGLREIKRVSRERLPAVRRLSDSATVCSDILIAAAKPC